MKIRALLEEGSVKTTLKKIYKKGPFTVLYIWVLGKLLKTLPNRGPSKEKAVRVMQRNWDYLIVLDACRCDFFREVIDGSAGCVISGGSYTQEWTEWNFDGDHDDIVYIAGNPHLASLKLKKTFGFIPFHEVAEVWDYGWDEAVKTVPPREVSAAALSFLDRYPEKRMIIHYNQPHHPFLADEELIRMDAGAWHTLKGRRWGGVKTTAYDLATKGKIPGGRIRQAYRENLKLVMQEVRKLTEKLNGKVIVTADHGDFLGEYGLYGHFGLRAKELVKVPWYVLKDEEGEKRPAKERAGHKHRNLKEQVRERLDKLKVAEKPP